MQHKVLHGLPQDNVFYHFLLHRLQGNLCSATWSISSASLFTDVGVCRIFISQFFLLFSLTDAMQYFLPVVNMLSQRHHQLADWLNFRQQWSYLELAGITHV